MIRIHHICHMYNQNTPMEFSAVNDFSLDIPKDDILAVIGANGSGKSTLLSLLSGQQKVQMGNIFFDDAEVINESPAKRAKRVAMVFQDPLAGTAPDLSILENLRLAYLRSTRRTLGIGINETFREMAKTKLRVLNMGLEDRLDVPVSSLSGGQRQALTLVMAGMSDADLLLLDEPTAALDPRSAEIVMQAAMQIIQDLKVPAILVTHNMQEALRYGKRLLLMEQGRVARLCEQQEKGLLDVLTIRSWFGDSL